MTKEEVLEEIKYIIIRHYPLKEQAVNWWDIKFRTFDDKTPADMIKLGEEKELLKFLKLMERDR